MGVWKGTVLIVISVCPFHVFSVVVIALALKNTRDFLLCGELVRAIKIEQQGLTAGPQVALHLIIAFHIHMILFTFDENVTIK